MGSGKGQQKRIKNTSVKDASKTDENMIGALMILNNNEVQPLSNQVIANMSNETADKTYAQYYLDSEKEKYSSSEINYAINEIYQDFFRSEHFAWKNKVNNSNDENEEIINALECLQKNASVEIKESSMGYFLSLRAPDKTIINSYSLHKKNIDPINFAADNFATLLNNSPYSMKANLVIMVGALLHNCILEDNQIRNRRSRKERREMINDRPNTKF